MFHFRQSDVDDGLPSYGLVKRSHAGHRAPGDPRSYAAWLLRLRSVLERGSTSTAEACPRLSTATICCPRARPVRPHVGLSRAEILTRRSRHFRAADPSRVGFGIWMLPPVVHVADASCWRPARIRYILDAQVLDAPRATDDAIGLAARSGARSVHEFDNVFFAGRAFGEAGGA
jgi:hypothetical protein